MDSQSQIPERDYRPMESGLGDRINPIPKTASSAWRSLLRRLTTPIALVGGVILKLGSLAKFASIFVAVAAYALIWPWSFAVGFVGLILVHELGHFVEARRRGFNATLPMFVPFLGAYVTIRDARMSPWQSFWISYSGPFWGSVGAAGVWLVGEQDGSNMLQALGYVGFLLNLFNLAPIGILDGGSIWRSISTMRLGGTPGKAQVAMAAYVGLAALLLLGMVAAHVPQHRL